MLQMIRNYIWGPPLLILILGTGVYLTLRLRGLQFRYLWHALKMVFTRHDDLSKGDISHFQALMTALAATIGIGNIAGVATAIATGGVGALFWMVVAALFGMATIYSEAFLSITYRIQDKRGEMVGGPMYYLWRGVGWRWLGICFAIAGALSALTTGNMVQSNSITDVVLELFTANRWIVGAIIAILIGIVLFGGIRSIGRVASILVPTMALFYLCGGLIIILLNLTQLPDAIATIFREAFSPAAPIGGSVGMFVALQMGVARGLFASEAGLGSTPIAAAAARTDVPGRQAMIAMTGAFLSVCVVCVVTGLVIAITGVSGFRGVSLTVAAFNSGLPYGKYIVIVGAMLFGYSTILGWSYYGEKCCEFLMGERIIPIYRVIFSLAIVLGAALELELVWGLADITNAFMAIPNLIGLIMLGGIVSRCTKGFLVKLRQERLQLL